MATMTYLQAISDAMREEMRADERVFVMGEDIGVFGGAFKVTDGFFDEFGASRVMDTPLAESGIIGTACGAAYAGLREEVKAAIDEAVATALESPVPDGETATDRVFADEPALLEDGNAPWSGFATAKEA